MMLAWQSTGQTRLLIATGEAAADVDELPPHISTLVQSASEILVITSDSRQSTSLACLGHLDRPYEADERLGVVLGHLEALAPDAKTQAQMGDETPLTAFDDAVRASIQTTS